MYTHIYIDTCVSVCAYLCVCVFVCVYLYNLYIYTCRPGLLLPTSRWQQAARERQWLRRQAPLSVCSSSLDTDNIYQRGTRGPLAGAVKPTELTSLGADDHAFWRPLQKKTKKNPHRFEAPWRRLDQRSARPRSSSRR